MWINKDFPYIKVTLIFGYLLLQSSLLIILTTSSSNGYEYNIYQVYPAYFWVFLILSLFLGQCTLIYYSILQIPNRLWIAGLTLMVTVNLVLIFMPLIRGYFSFEDEDVFTHIGMIKDILHTGFVGKSNMYPAIHVFGSVISLISGLNIHTVTMVIPGLFAIIFMLGNYLLLKNFFPDSSKLLYGLSFTLPLCCGRAATLFIPNAEAYLVLPLILYLIIGCLRGNENTKYFAILSITVGMAIVFWHPLITLCVLILLGTLYCLHLIPIVNTSIHLDKSILLSIMLIILCVFLSWSAYLTLFVKTIRPILESIFGVEEHVSTFQYYSTLASSANVPLDEIIPLVMSVYGQLIVLVTMTLFCLAIYLSTLLRQKNRIDIKTIFSLCSFCIFLSFSLALFLVGGADGFNRILLVAVLFSPIIIASIWKIDLPHLSNFSHIFKIGCILIVLLCITFFSTYNQYYSPLVKYPNDQVSESVFIGTASFFQARDDNLPILELGLPQFRYYTAIYGNNVPVKNVVNYAVSSLTPVDHFGYNSYNSIAYSYDGDHYFLTTIRGKFFYPMIYPKYGSLWRFTPNDFDRLKNDPGAHRLYSGGDLEIYLIQ